MAFHTALAFLALCVGILFARPNVGLMVVFSGETAGGTVARRLVPAAILIPVFLGWLRMMGEHAGLYGTAVGAAFSAVAHILVFAILVYWIAWLLHGRDLERGRIETALRDSEERYRLLFASNPHPVWVYDTENLMILDVNETAVRSYGYSREAFLSMTIKDIRPREDLPALLDSVANSTADIQSADEWRHCKKDGALIDVEITSHKIAYRGSTARLVVATDITKRKRAERHLAAQYAVAQVLAKATTLREAAPKLLEIICTGLRWKLGALWTVDHSSNVLRCTDVWYDPTADLDEFANLTRQTTFAPGFAHLGRVWSTDRPTWVPDVLSDGTFLRAPVAARCGLRGAFASPIAIRCAVGGVLEFLSGEIREPDAVLSSLMTALSDQIGLFMERRHAEEALQASERRLAGILDIAEDAIISVDESQIIRLFNQGAEKIFGYTAQAVLGQSLSLLIPDRFVQAHRQHVHNFASTPARARRMGERTAVYGRRKDGSEFPAEASISKLGGDKGTTFTVIVRDISERKRAEEQLQKLSQAVEQATDPVVISNLGGTIEYVNPAFERLTGFTAPEAIGQKPRIVRSGRHPQEFYENIWDTILAGLPWQGVFVNRKKDGEIYFAETSITPIFSSERQITHFVAVQKDITERRLAEETAARLNESLQRRTAELEFTNKELEAFCYSVSHDLRAPLRGIDGFSQALLEDYAGRLDSQGQDYLRRVRTATQRMDLLIDDLLNLSRVTRAEICEERIELSALANSVAAELQRVQPGRRVEFVIAPELHAKGDARLLRQVFENLLGNAWKLTSKRPIARIEFGSAAQGGSTTYFVRDNGAGFDPAYTDKLFGVFQRLHAMTEFPGTGVGLATVQRIIHRHGGRVWAEAAVEQGATFYFTLGIA